MNKMTTMPQSKYPYLVTALGVGLMAVSELYSFIRGMMFRAMFHPGGGYGSGFSGGRQFGGGVGFGLPSILTTIALIVAIVGVIWLGLTLRKSTKA
jgi:uncharacterized membrane protein